MKFDRTSLSLAAVLILLCGVVSYWQAPGSRLTQAEIDAALARIEQNLPMPAADKTRLLANMRYWGEADDGKPVHMLNLMRFRKKLQPWPETTPHGQTPEEANEYYEEVATGIALPMGLAMSFAGSTQPVTAEPSRASGTGLIDDDSLTAGWDRVLVVRYPNRRAFFNLISDPKYLAVAHNKFAAVQLTLVPMSAMTITPDLRLVVWLVALLIFLSVGWFRASRHARLTM